MVGNTINDPRNAFRLVFNTAPTSGENRSGYPKYTTHLELRDDDVRTWAGKEVTVSCRVRTGVGQQFPFFLYISQGLGSAGVVGTPNTNTITDLGRGIDRTGVFKEIFCRSAQLLTRVDGDWDQYSTTFTLDDLASSTIASGNVLSIGIGMNYDGIAATERLDITCLKVDEGGTVLPWREWPDGANQSLADFNYQLLGLGVSGFVKSATTLLLNIPFRGTMRAPGGAITLLNPSPVFDIAGVSKSGSGSTPTIRSINQYGAAVEVDGFTGLVAGDPVVYVGGPPIFAVSVD